MYDAKCWRIAGKRCDRWQSVKRKCALFASFCICFVKHKYLFRLSKVVCFATTARLLVDINVLRSLLCMYIIMVM